MQSSKIIRNAVLGVVAIVVLIWLAGKLHPAYVRHHLRHALGEIEPWGPSTDYSDAAWKKLISAARVFQSARVSYVDEVLSDYGKSSLGPPDSVAADQSKAYLLLRMMFDLPAQAAGRPPFADWAGAAAHPNSNGTANLAWPLVFAGDKPHLASGRETTNGTYVPREEYDYFRYHYHSRDLSKLSL